MTARNQSHSQPPAGAYVAGAAKGGAGVSRMAEKPLPGPSTGISMTWPQYQRGECTANGQRLYMPPLRTEILSTLLIRRGHVVSLDELADVCWPDPDYMPEAPEKNIMVHISKLRALIPGLIETCWGRGFFIALADEPQSIAA